MRFRIQSWVQLQLKGIQTTDEKIFKEGFMTENIEVRKER